MSTKKATVSTKGYLIDPNCKYNTWELVEDNGVVYSCTLNQTEIGSNKNKFYIMQVIQNGSKYCVFVRYGRIGETGRTDYKEHSSLAMAKTFFERQFRSKTGNSWSVKDDFEKKDGKYFLAEIECADVDDISDSDVSESESESETEDEMDERVADFLRLISNQTYMKNTLVELEIDTEKMPLGKIRQSQIDKAYEILDEINKSIKKGNSDKLTKLSSQFYTLIPIAYGRRKPPVISTTKLVGKNINLLNELSQMVFGTVAITKIKNSKNKNVLGKLYEDLHTEIVPLEKTDQMYEDLVSYLNRSKAPTHNFSFEVIDIFSINREFERDAYETYSKKIPNKTLLFHGTRVSNLIGILKNGLVVDPSKLQINVSISGKMFGLGIYGATSSSKSIQYCAYDTSDNIACMFIMEVALGKMLKKTDADSSLTSKTLPREYHSTWGLGKSSFAEYEKLDDGTRIPKGKIAPVKTTDGRYLLYDEFIVYHEEQINLRYIVKLKILDDDDDY